MFMNENLFLITLGIVEKSKEQFVFYLYIMMKKSCYKLSVIP